MELELDWMRRGFDRDLANPPFDPALTFRPVVGKRTLTESLPPAPAMSGPVQRKASGPAAPSAPGRGIHELFVQRTARGASSPDQVHRAASAGVRGGGQSLPYLAQLQAAFGAAHDLSSIRAHIGGDAADSCDAIGAEAYAVGDQVAFRGAPGLHVAAHEAAHVVQQRRGVALAGGVGAVGDVYERHADAVADAVVAGQSAAQLLAEGPGGAGASSAVQRSITLEGETFEDNKRYEKYDDLPETFRQLVQSATVPQDLADQFGEALDHDEARKLFRDTIVDWADNEEQYRSGMPAEILEQAWIDVGDQLRPIIRRREQDRDHQMGTDVLDREHRTEELIQKLSELPLDRLMRIAGLAEGTAETAGFFTVTRPDVSVALAEVCETYRNKLNEIKRQNDDKPNYLRGLDDKQILPAIKEAGDHLLETYPPETHVYIGLGASPAPITKYLELSKAKSSAIEVYDLPLSGLQGQVYTIKDTWEQEDQQKKQNLTAFIDQYLSKLVPSEKSVVVLDFSSGNTLYVAEYIIGEYLKAKDSSFDPGQVIPVSLMESGGGDFTGAPPSGSTKIRAMNLHTDAFKQLVEGLQSSWFKDFGYRETAKNTAEIIMGGTHVTHHLLGGYERLLRDLGPLFED